MSSGFLDIFRIGIQSVNAVAVIQSQRRRQFSIAASEVNYDTAL
jgi:hypothetical protein